MTRSRDGVELAYTTHRARGASTGPTVALVHGWLGSRTYWDAQLEALTGRHNVIALDLGGHGESGAGREPDAIETEPRRPNQIGMHRVAFSVEDIDEALEVAARHGCHPLRGVATYENLYKLTYLRGPSGILVMLAQEMKTA